MADATRAGNPLAILLPKDRESIVEYLMSQAIAGSRSPGQWSFRFVGKDRAMAMFRAMKGAGYDVSRPEGKDCWIVLKVPSQPEKQPSRPPKRRGALARRLRLR